MSKVIATITITEEDIQNILNHKGTPFETRYFLTEEKMIELGRVIPYHALDWQMVESLVDDLCDIELFD